LQSRRFWLWRAVDDEGEVPDLLLQRRRDKAAALKLMRKLLKKHGCAPEVLVTDKLRSYAAAKSELRLTAGHEQGLRRNNQPVPCRRRSAAPTRPPATRPTSANSSRNGSPTTTLHQNTHLSMPLK
jgi:transposase-like protein